ncbi:MAG: T9SS type A sorting domain-containing protein [Bacteroidota bacterium]
MTKRFIVITLLGIILPAVELYAQNVVYVNQAATGANTGASWGDAFIFLQDALDAAQSGDEIWVAAGIYRPDRGMNVSEGDRNATFSLKSNVGIYGGFVGDESNRISRDTARNKTVFSGDLLEDDSDRVFADEPSRQDNSYHVITAIDLSDLTVLDGLFISDGNTGGASFGTKGAGLFVSQADLKLDGVTVEANTSLYGGGGMYVFNSKLTVLNSFLLNNTAALPPPGLDGEGGGIYYLSGDSLVVENTVFKGNSASDGGGLWQDAETAQINGVSFLANSAVLGGGFYNFKSDAYIINTFWGGNEAIVGAGGLMNENSDPHLTNVIFSGNRTTGDLLGGGAVMNYESNPRFINSVFNKNNAVGRGGVMTNDFNSNVTLINCILGDNTAAQGEQIWNTTQGVSITNSSHSMFLNALPDGLIDEGQNLVAEPLFANPLGIDGVAGTQDDDLSLLPTSPAIDNGDNNRLPMDKFDLDGDGNITEYTPSDFAQNKRIFDGGSGDEVVDMGALEFDAPSVFVSNEVATVNREYSIRIYPNPFRFNATIQICVTFPQKAQIVIYDLLGREVEELYHGQLQSGCVNSFDLNGMSLSSGIYYMRVFGQGSKTAKIVKM